MKLIYLSVGIIFLSSIIYFSQIINPSLAAVRERQEINMLIEVGEDRLVSVEKTAFPLVEPYLAANPKNPANLLATTIVIAKPDLSSLDCATYASFDAGVTWKRWHLGLSNCADAWAAFMPDGTAVLSVLEIAANKEEQFLIYRSKDGGLTWKEKPVNLGKGHDHPTLLVDRTGKKFDGSLYAVSANSWKNSASQGRSSLFIARSIDGGGSFQEPTRVITSNLLYEAHNPALLSDGTLLVPFADHRRQGDRRQLERQRDWLVTSTDAGKTFSEPLFISENCSGAGGWSSLAVDTSESRFKDRIYHICAARQFDGIQVRYSDNRGEKWSDPIRVDRPVNVEPYTRTPAIAVNKNGVVGIVWYDGRADGSTIKGIFRCQELYFAASIDGGETFLPETKVSAKRSCPASPQNINTSLRFPAGGEYIGMAVTPDGAFHTAWADNRTGTYSLHTSTIKVAPTVR